MATTGDIRCPKATDAVLQKIAKLHGETSLSYFTIICGDKSRKVHRLVLTLHSIVLQVACTRPFKEEQDRNLDLSDDDPDSIGAFVHYLYHLDYDAALFKKDATHLSFHVQMCILGDKYDMRALQSLATEKFRTLTTTTPPTADEFADAAVCPYDAPGATIEIREMIVNLVVENELIRTEISAEPATDLERAIQSCPGLSLDIIKVQQRMVKPAPKRFRCPRCRQSSSHAITPQNINEYFQCSRCHRDCDGWQWAQYPE